MKIKSLLSLALAGMAFSALAQTHAEGVEYYEADQIENAKELLNRNLNNPGTDKSIAYYYKGQIALREGKTAEAADCFAKGVQANPEYAYNYIGLGELDLKNNNVKAAEDNFKKAEGLAKKDASVYVAIARAYDAANPETYAKQIDKNIEKARKKDIKNPDIYIFEGDVLARTNDYGGAGAKYEMAANNDPNATAAYFKYATLFRQVNPGYGIAMLQKLLQLNPNSALGQRSLANAYYENNQFKEAAAEYGNYVKNPNHFKQDEDRYAFLLFYGQDYPAGYKYASELLAKDPSNFTAMRYQFMNAAQMPELADQLLPMAEKLYAARKANPAKNVFAPIDYILVSEEMQKAKQYDEAYEVLQDGIKAMPTNASFYKQLAMLDVDRNDMPGASEAYDGYIKNTPEPGYNDLIQAAVFAFYAGVQDKDSDPAASKSFYEKAAKYADQAIAYYPDQYRPLKIKGDIAFNNNDKAAGVEYYKQAIEKLKAMDDNLNARYASDAKNMYNMVGNDYLDKNDKVKAKEYFNGYLLYDPNDDSYRKFVNSL